MRSLRWTAVALSLVVAACSGGGDEDAAPDRTTAVTTTTPAVTAHALPIGDGRYATAPKKGYVFSCQTSFPSNAPGAFRTGPWFDAAAGTWDPAEKIAVQGAVQHGGQLTGHQEAGRELLTGNGLPLTPTGVFPVAASDPAAQYDRNPNPIQGHDLRVDLPAAPVPASTPTCVGGTIGVSVLGVPIFSAFDAGGRDAAAHEVQDACDGHPELTGQYHFHSLSRCFAGAHVDAAFDQGLFGYALDGFGIYVEEGTVTSADLDECHGRTSEVTWHGQHVSMYHYVATADFPYLVGCFRGAPITSATGLRLGSAAGPPPSG
jgi:hypothetical protein